MIWFVLGLVVIGCTAGAVASMRVPDDETMGIGTTALLGVFGAFVGGSLGWVLFGSSFAGGVLQPSGFLGAAIGASLVLAGWRAVTLRHTVGR